VPAATRITAQGGRRRQVGDGVPSVAELMAAAGRRENAVAFGAVVGFDG
jgi:hypothetical protein